MTLQFDPRTLIWDRFGGLEKPDPNWSGDLEYWEGFNAAFFTANGKSYNPERDSNVKHWLGAHDRASFSDMVAALSPQISRQDLSEVDMVILAHWLPDLHLGSSVTNFAMHHLGIQNSLGFAISDRGLSAPLFAFDFAAKAIKTGRSRKILLLIMDQKNLLYRDPLITDLQPENVAAAMVLGGNTPGLAYRGYAHRTDLAPEDLPSAVAELRADWGLSRTAVLVGSPGLEALIPGTIEARPNLVCAAPFVALAEHTDGRDAMLLTWQFDTLTALGFAGKEISHAA